MRRAVAEDKAGPIVEFGGDEVEVGSGVHGEVGALREVLTEQSVGVLVGGPLPGCSGLAEEDAYAGRRFDLLVETGRPFQVLSRTIMFAKQTSMPWRWRTCFRRPLTHVFRG